MWIWDTKTGILNLLLILDLCFSLLAMTTLLLDILEDTFASSDDSGVSRKCSEAYVQVNHQETF